MYRYFYSAIFLRLWSLHAYLNYITHQRDWIERESNLSRDFHQIKLCLEIFNRQLQCIMVEVHSSGINSVELSASSSHMLR